MKSKDLIAPFVRKTRHEFGKDYPDVITENDIEVTMVEDSIYKFQYTPGGFENCKIYISNENVTIKEEK